MAKTDLGLYELCSALGVDDPNTVTRVVVDIRAGNFPMLYVERIGDAQKIVAALREPGIDLRREQPDVLHARDGADWRLNRCGAEGGEATSDEEATCPACRALISPANGPVVHGNVSGANIAWGNGSVTQRS